MRQSGEPVRILDRARVGFENKRTSGKRSGTCGTPSCLSAPHEGKPYCREHLDQMPYVRALLETMAQRAHEVEGRRPPKVLIDEAVVLLADLAERVDTISTSLLAKELRCPVSVALKVVKGLKLKCAGKRRGEAIWSLEGRRAS